MIRRAGRPAIRLELDVGGTRAFEPGASVTGTAIWSAEVPPRGMELRLSWKVHGKGGSDFKIVETVALADPRASERRPFTFTLPVAPYSFRGSLIQLIWSLELVALPEEATSRVDLVVAPGREIIDLRSTPVDYRHMDPRLPR
jgi:hypothetical protein